MDRYEEALARAKQGLPIDQVFPELAESEDERTRKDIVVSVELRLTQSEKAEIYAYLEKLKESLHISETCKENADSFTKDLVNNPQTSAEILRHYLVWAENSEEDCPYTWKALADAIRDGIKALEDQKLAEWSEEDETRFINIIIMLKEYVIHHYSEDDVNKSVNWLENRVKFLRPQPHWKPSEEQMAALVSVTKNLFAEMPERHRLESLYKDLKKLM